MLPLTERYPALASVPRIAFGRGPTPVVRLSEISDDLWIKRDDLFADPIGGNKARALEFLLGGVGAGSRVTTVGSVGSTHALAVATYGAMVGAQIDVGLWRQEMNATARQVITLTQRRSHQTSVFRTPVGAYLWAWRQRARGALWIAAGGSTPLGILGHVNAGLELIDQIDGGAFPAPRQVVVPLGTGGTAAGLALAFAIARRKIVVVGVRVVPRIVGRKRRVLALAERTRQLIARLSDSRPPRVDSRAVRVVHDAYGGAYGRETLQGCAASDRFRTVASVELDGTYSAKAAAALENVAHGPTLFWLTFDSRVLTGGPDSLAAAGRRTS